MTDETNSLREDLEAAWDSLAAEAEDETPEPEPDDDPPEEEEYEAAEPEEEEDEEDEADGAAEDAYLPASHWPAEWRARFEALPDEAKPYALDLHGQFEKAHSERSQALAEREKELAGLTEVDAALAPWREVMQAQGISDGEAVSKLLEAHALLEQDPEAALAMIAGSYGAAPPSLPAAAQPADPEARHGALLDSLEHYAAEQHELRMLAAMEAELEARARAADADGRPRFPHFDAVRPRLAALIRGARRRISKTPTNRPSGPIPSRGRRRSSRTMPIWRHGAKAPARPRWRRRGTPDGPRSAAPNRRDPRFAPPGRIARSSSACGTG